MELSLFETFYYKHRGYLHTRIYNLQNPIAGVIQYVSIKEYLELYHKLTKSDFEAFEKFLIDRKIRVSLFHIFEELRERPMCRVVWSCPMIEWTKINVAATFKMVGGIGYFAGGVVLRDWDGYDYASRYFHNLNARSVIDAEFEALKRRIILAKKVGCYNSPTSNFLCQDYPALQWLKFCISYTSSIQIVKVPRCIIISIPIP
ncbi:hypothetical protein L1049_015173 [Liquidambar formosana]|uniref:Uncharacterized protein n=1 Tax=Liquidambar formosana TaxID=63359 RepID=A0AAP0RYF0_LIQFO